MVRSSVFEYADALRLPVFIWPVPAEVYGWLLVMVIASSAWIVGAFLAVTNRETIIFVLQADAFVSSLTAMIFSGFAGWQFGASGLQWWLVVPWLAAVLNALLSAWLGINNAAQKPFLSQQGTM